ncbi:MAG TPA: Crp/Fnr family transcriptional regulator [Bryobacteraceae bacterium]|nr:Crp/Fnr family transcriptional regulator [Bryobacteraceae bacterium]
MGRNYDSTRPLEDALTYLPRKPVQQFAKRAVVYDRGTPGSGLHLLVFGRLKISHCEDGPPTVTRIVTSEGLFGESSLIGAQNRGETAIALDDSGVMTWSRGEIEQHVEREPRLGIALSQFLVQRLMELQDRIESMAIRKTPERVMLALVQLAGAVGTPMSDGSTRLASLTHHTISEYVGTSREIVTFEMNRLRRKGLLRYSRKHIDIHADLIREVGYGSGTPHEATVGSGV